MDEIPGWRQRRVFALLFGLFAPGAGLAVPTLAQGDKIFSAGGKYAAHPVTWIRPGGVGGRRDAAVASSRERSQELAVSDAGARLRGR